MATRMQQRRGTAQQWTDADPILAAGEIGFETDTNQFKIGDGVNAWSDLSYFKNLEDLGGSLDDYVPVSTKGQANGVASLDSTGNVPASQLQNVLDGAPAALDTLNEISAALGDDSNYAATILNALDAKAGTNYVNLHKDATTGVHGIADTATLATRTYVADEVGTHNSDSTSVHGIADTSLLATTEDVSTALDSALSAVSSHESDTTSIHGISDTANLVYTSDLSTHASDTVSIHGISDTANLVYSADLSAHNLDTTLVHGISNTANLVYSADLSAHTGSSTSVHGIADTAALATKSYADSAISTHNSDETNVHGIADTAALATKTYADGAVSTAVAALTKSSVGLANVDNTSDANKPVSTATQTELDLKAPKANPTFTGTVAGITKSMVGLGNVDNTADADKPVSTAAQTALNLKANLAGPTFTGTVSLPSTTSIGNVSATELGYVDGVTSAIQTQIDSKLALAGGTMTGALTLSADPTSDLHAATKQYVDAATAGLNVHAAVKAATTANINLTNGVKNNDTLDGVTLATGNRILVKNQNTTADNGVYIVGAGAATRATDYDSTPEVDAGDFIFVEGGTVNGKTGWVQTNFITTIGTDAIAFTQFSGSGTYTAGSGLTLTGTTFSIADGAITSAKIADGAIVDADVNASAAIAQSKISGLTSDLAAKAPLASPTFTGTVTVSSSGVAFTDGTQTKEGVVSRTPIIQKTASYTLSALSERDSLIEVSNASATTITVPLNATVAYPVGTSIDILQTGAGQVSIVGTAGVTLNCAPSGGSNTAKLRTTWSSATLFKRATDTWVVFGDLTA